MTSETDAFTYHPYFHPKWIYQIARWGADDREIAAELGIPITMLDDWKQKHPEIITAIGEGRRYWFDLAESSIHKLVKGFTADETETIIKVDPNSAEQQAKPTQVKKRTRQVPPNAAAIKFLIENSYVFKLAKELDPEMLAAMPPLPKKS